MEHGPSIDRVITVIMSNCQDWILPSFLNCKEWVYWTSDILLPKQHVI